MTRALVRLVTVVALAAAVLLVPSSLGAPSGSAQAADLSFFDPGNIIADAVFFDYQSMDTGAVQAFLNAKGANCAAGEMPCLKDFRQSTATEPGDSYCATYPGAANESAAAILAKVGVACHINPRVLIVLLQKEEGLVTGTQLEAWQYNSATGMGCPDTAACNPAFSGFASQVYFAARQFQVYASGDFTIYFAGRDNTIYWSPNHACGTSTVFIQNKATAGLYDYTPYRPNAAALAAGYGTGDACSAYGNRNFWLYFTDWFGSTQSAGGAAIYAYYQQIGGSGGWLGAPVQTFHCGLRDGGCFQPFQNGAIYWSPASGAHSITGGVRDGWAARGWETGPLGYPVSDTNCGLVYGGCFQDFQGGSLYWSPGSGAFFVRGAIKAEWGATGWEGGWLGYPTSDEVCGLVGGGCFTHFQGGSIYWTAPLGAHVVNLPIQNRWAGLGWERGPLGYPIAEPLCALAGGGCRQDFQGGSMYWSPGGWTAYTRGPVQATWEANHAQDGPLGYPVTDVACGLVGGGCQQAFHYGLIYWSPATGGHTITGDVGAAWLAKGAQNGPLGYPVNEVNCTLAGGGCRQDFQGGNLYWSRAGGGAFVRGLIDAKWESLAAQDGPLSYPVTDEICGLRNGGCFNHFQNGSIYWTPALGAHPVSGPIRDTWAAQGWERGRWGYPVADPTTAGTVTTQRFEGGTATYDTTVGQVTFG